MYVPNHFAAADADALIQRLARRRAGVLVSVDADGAPIATHLPVLWNSETRTISGVRPGAIAVSASACTS